MGAAPAEGTLLLGKLRIEEVLGEGGMGVVCKAHHLHLDQPVAIKCLLRQLITNRAVVTRFLREAQAASRLRNEHIARVIDVGKLEDGAPYMLMEYLEGADLGAIIKHYGAQEPAIAADLLLQACEGIAEAHAIGIIHRDIKPSNFFITRRPDGTPLLKILDFGISKAPQSFETELTRTSSVIGTPAYMAPEQMRSARNADHRSDLWSMGVVLYQTISGRRPFDSEAYSEMCLKVGMDPPEPLEADISAEYEAVIMRCLEKNPDRRFQNVAELAWALVPFATDPALARGSAERASRILGVKVSGVIAVPGRITGELSAPAITPMPELHAVRASREMATQRTPVSSPGSWPGSSPGEPALPLLSAGPMAPADALPHGGKAHPTSVSASAGQVSPSRSMPVAAPSRRGWVLGVVAVVAVGVGGWYFLRRDDTDAPRPAAGTPAREVVPTGFDDSVIAAPPDPAAPPPAADVEPAAEVAPEPVPAGDPAAAGSASTPTAGDPAATEKAAGGDRGKRPRPRDRTRSKPRPRERGRGASGGGVFDKRE